MSVFKRSAWAAMCALTAVGCSVELPDPIPMGMPFITKGTFELRDVFGAPPCPIWVDNTGMIYHLFQDESVSNGDFDRVTTPGVTSRLKLATRSDLNVGCLIGVPVEVKEVLEVIE